MATRYLIAGASGTVGSRIVESLVAAGAEVRATTSRKQAAERRNGL